MEATSPLGVQLSLSVAGVPAEFGIEGVPIVLVGEVLGVVIPVVVEFRKGEGDAGDSGLRKGDA